MNMYKKVQKVALSYDYYTPLKAGLREIMQVFDLNPVQIKGLSDDEVDEIIEYYNDNDEIKKFLLIINLIDYEEYYHRLENVENYIPTRTIEDRFYNKKNKADYIKIKGKWYEYLYSSNDREQAIQIYEQSKTILCDSHRLIKATNNFEKYIMIIHAEDLTIEKDDTNEKELSNTY